MQGMSGDKNRRMSSRRGLWTELWLEAERRGEGSDLDRMKLALLSRGSPWEDLVAEPKKLDEYRRAYRSDVAKADAAWSNYRRMELAARSQRMAKPYDVYYSDSSSSDESDMDFDDDGADEEEDDDQEEEPFVERDVVERIAKDVPRTLSGVFEVKRQESFFPVSDLLDDPLGLTNILFGGGSWLSSREQKIEDGPTTRHSFFSSFPLMQPPTETAKKKQKSLVEKLGRKRRRRLARALLVGSARFGYCQGMNFVFAALAFEDEGFRTHDDDVFALYVYLLRDLHVDLLYGRTLASYLGALKCLLRKEVPRVADRFDAVGFEPQLYAVEWFSALFAVSLPRTLCLALFDLVFVGFRDAPLRFGVGLVKAHEAKILDSFRSFDDLALGFKNLIRTTDPTTALLNTVAVAPALTTADFLDAVAGDQAPVVTQSYDKHLLPASDRRQRSRDLPPVIPVVKTNNEPTTTTTTTTTHPTTSPAPVATDKDAFGPHFDWIFSDLVS